MLKAVLVGADFDRNGMIDYYMEELSNLAKASNIEVVYSVTQALDRITPTFYVGKGKVEEIKTFVNNLDADMVIFNNELSGSQVRNLEEAIESRVLDRTLLILDIFASRAKSKEAMLQVEIAQLEYLKPRLTGLRPSLNRQQGGIGSRGPGEKKLELDRRKITTEIAKLNNELKEVVKARKVQRKTRNKSNIKKVAIVGYTNSGKSTLLNGLVELSQKETGKEVLAKDMLFATLETATRHITLENNKDFVVTDTVGFVSNLPHNLVESFKSTLEEITEADYLVHVVDASHEQHKTQIEVTNSTLREIGVHDIPTLYVYNKMDLTNEEVNPTFYPCIETILRDNKGISMVLDLIQKDLFKDHELVTLLIPFTEGDLVHYLNENTNVLSQEYNNDGAILELELSQIQKAKYANYIIKK